MKAAGRTKGILQATRREAAHCPSRWRAFSHRLCRNWPVLPCAREDLCVSARNPRVSVRPAMVLFATLKSLFSLVMGTSDVLHHEGMLRF